MQVLDAEPELARLARASATIGVRDGLTVIEAEAGTLSGAAVDPRTRSSAAAIWLCSASPVPIRCSSSRAASAPRLGGEVCTVVSGGAVKPES